MKKLLLALVLLAYADSLRGMEPEKQPVSTVSLLMAFTKSLCVMEPQEQPTHTALADPESELSPINLPHTYYCLKQTLNKDVALYIASLQLATHCRKIIATLQKKMVYGADLIALWIDSMLKLEWISHDSITKLCKQYFLSQEETICNIDGGASQPITGIPRYFTTSLFAAVHRELPEVIKILIQVAGDDKEKLLTTQNELSSDTVLHWAVNQKNIEIVKLLLDAAGDNVRPFMAIMGQNPKTGSDFCVLPAITVFDLDTSADIKELLINYLEK